MRNYFALCLVLIFGNLVNAQDSIPSKLLEKYKFRSIGPAGMSGRITSIKVDPNNDQKIYAGSASGGLWRSKNGGQSWESLFDNEKVSSVGALALDPHNPDVIWLGTGEGNPRNSLTSGYGLYRSIDGGRNWELMGLEETRNIHRIIVHPHDPKTIYVGAIGTPWGDSEHRGVYKSTDGGQSWMKILYIDEKTGAADMVMDPKNPEKLIVAMWEHRRQPWIFKSGGSSSGLYVTYNGGQDWSERTDKNGLPKGDLGRLGIAIAPSKPDRIYALVEHKGDNALYRSDDAGQNWKKVSEDNQIGNRPFYYSELYVDPKNENRIFSLWSGLSMSEDAGKTWKALAPYSRVHPDHHAFFIHPNDPSYIIEGNDGGLNISRDGGHTWRFVENLPLAQFYHINYDMDLPYNIYGGMQDNGSWKGPAYVWSNDGIRNSYWEELYFGDGFDVVPDPADNRFVYAMSQEGHLAHVDTRTGHSTFIQPVHPEGEDLRFHWNAALASDPFDDHTVYYGAQYVFKSKDKGRKWELISPDLTTNDSTKQKYKESGGLTYDVTGAENHTTILSIEPSPLEKDLLWVGTDDGNLQLSRDGGKNWTLLSSNLKGMPRGSWIPQIVVSTHKKGAAFVVVNDYRRNNWDSYLYYTEDYGKSFRRLSSPESVWGYNMSVAQDYKNENLLFLGTNIGLYFSWDFGGHWQKWGKDFPTVPVADLKIHPREGDLIAGTFGRSCLVLDDLEPLRWIASNAKDLQGSTKLKVMDPPVAYHASFKSPDGTRFAAHAIFRGDNRDRGARFSFWNGHIEKDSLKAKNISVKIYDRSGNQIRQLWVKHNKGLNRFRWDLDAKTAHLPGRTYNRNDTNERAGLKVLPGLYKVVMKLGDHVDSTTVDVRPDPRMKYDVAAMESSYRFRTDFYNKLDIVKEAVFQMQSSQRTLKRYGDLLDEMADREKAKALKDTVKALEKKLKAFEERVFGKKVEGYFDQPKVLVRRYYKANRYLTSNNGRVTESSKILTSEFLEAVQEFLADLNAFYEKDWADFQRISGGEVQLFGEVKTFETN